MYYLTLTNENLAMPPMPEGCETGIIEGLYPWAPAPSALNYGGSVLFSGPANVAARQAATRLAEDHGIGVDLWSATSYKQLRAEALETERWNRLHPEAEPRTPRVTRLLTRSPDGHETDASGSSDSAPVVAVTDYLTMVPDQVARWVPRPFSVLGTDGFGRSDTRAKLRGFFEVDARHIVVAVLAALARAGRLEPEVVAKAIRDADIDPDVAPPWQR